MISQYQVITTSRRHQSVLPKPPIEIHKFYKRAVFSRLCPLLFKSNMEKVLYCAMKHVEKLASYFLISRRTQKVTAIKIVFCLHKARHTHQRKRTEIPEPNSIICHQMISKQGDKGRSLVGAGQPFNNIMKAELSRGPEVGQQPRIICKS